MSWGWSCCIEVLSKDWPTLRTAFLSISCSRWRIAPSTRSRSPKFPQYRCTSSAAFVKGPETHKRGSVRRELVRTRSFASGHATADILVARIRGSVRIHRPVHLSLSVWIALAQEGCASTPPPSGSPQTATRSPMESRNAARIAAAAVPIDSTQTSTRSSRRSATLGSFRSCRPWSGKRCQDQSLVPRTRPNARDQRGASVASAFLCAASMKTSTCWPGKALSASARIE